MDASAGAAYQTQIRWTSYGIPHVTANDSASLGYGFAYATATDAVCVIARDIVMVNGNLSTYMGTENGNLESDVFHRALLTEERLQRFARAMPIDNSRYNAGYVAGYNRYLRDHAGKLPASCNGLPWVRPMVVEDVARLMTGFAIRYGLGFFKNDVARAAPPGEPVAAGSSQFSLDAGLGSNAVAFGKDVTDSGRGMHVWTEFWRIAADIENIYAIPFDANDPVNTPRGIALDSPGIRAALRLRAGGILTYSQSQEPESAHYSDLTEVYSRGEWIDFPFTEEEILADPNLVVLTLTEPLAQ